jgi:hypothetical protein
MNFERPTSSLPKHNTTQNRGIGRNPKRITQSLNMAASERCPIVCSSPYKHYIYLPFQPVPRHTPAFPHYLSTPSSNPSSSSLSSQPIKPVSSYQEPYISFSGLYNSLYSCPLCSAPSTTTLKYLTMSQSNGNRFLPLHDDEEEIVLDGNP